LVLHQRMSDVWGLSLARTSSKEVDPWSSAMAGGVGGLSGHQKTRLAFFFCAATDLAHPFLIKLDRPRPH
jgi:hypothetical protein